MIMFAVFEMIIPGMRVVAVCKTRTSNAIHFPPFGPHPPGCRVQLALDRILTPAYRPAPFPAFVAMVRAVSKPTTPGSGSMCRAICVPGMAVVLGVALAGCLSVPIGSSTQSAEEIERDRDLEAVRTV